MLSAEHVGRFLRGGKGGVEGEEGGARPAHAGEAWGWQGGGRSDFRDKRQRRDFKVVTLPGEPAKQRVEVGKAGQWPELGKVPSPAGRIKCGKDRSGRTGNPRIEEHGWNRRRKRYGLHAFAFAAHQGGHAPLGLAVGDGVTLSPFSPRRWGGVLVRRDGESAILPLAVLPDDAAWDHALQSSPILVADGANDMLGDDGRLDNRLAVVLDGSGGLALVGAFRDGGGAVSLHSFAEMLLALGPLAGLAPEGALALDGGSSAAIVLPGADRSWGGSLPGYMPNALCLAPPGP